MYTILNKYLFLHKSIPLPGLGTICHGKPGGKYRCKYQKHICHPFTVFVLINFLIHRTKIFLLISLRNKIFLTMKHCGSTMILPISLRDRLNYFREAPWEGLGILKKDDMGEIHFESSILNPSFLQPVPAEKVVRANAKHMLLVGDRESSNSEMSDWFAEEPVHGNRLWWLVALIGGIAAVTGDHDSFFFQWMEGGIYR